MVIRRCTCRWVFLSLAIAGLFSVGNAQESPQGERKVVTRIAPRYPEIARNIRLGGNVKIDAVVGPDGVVRSVEVKGGNPVLAESAKTAVLQWKWGSSHKETHELVEVKFTPE